LVFTYNLTMRASKVPSPTRSAVIPNAPVRSRCRRHLAACGFFHRSGSPGGMESSTELAPLITCLPRIFFHGTHAQPSGTRTCSLGRRVGPILLRCAGTSEPDPALIDAPPFCRARAFHHLPQQHQRHEPRLFEINSDTAVFSRKDCGKIHGAARHHASRMRYFSCAEATA